MVKKLVIVLLIISLLLIGLPLAALAHGGGECCPERPGNGFGDENHCHTGPPGLTGIFPWELTKTCPDN